MMIIYVIFGVQLNVILDEIKCVYCCVVMKWYLDCNFGCEVEVYVVFQEICEVYVIFFDVEQCWVYDEVFVQEMQCW